MGVYVICSLFSYYLAILYLVKVFSPIYLILLPHICGFMVYIMGRFRWVYVSVSLYIYSIEEPGALGDTGSGAWVSADPLPLRSFFSPSSFLVRGRGVGGVGWYMLHICYTALC